MKLVPAAVTVCPALVMASYKFRLFMPFAKLPTLFLMVLPMLYVPMAWVLNSFAWQLLASEVFFMFFIIFNSFSQLVWTLEVVVYKFHEPMSRPFLNRTLKKMGAMSVFMIIMTYTFFVVWIGTRFKWFQEMFNVLPDDIQSQIWDRLADTLHEPPIVAILQVVVAVIFKLWLSKVAAYDFIVKNLTAEYAFDHSVKQMKFLLDDFKTAYKDKEMKSRLARMEQVTLLADEQAETLESLAALAVQSELTAFQRPGKL